MIMSSRQVHPGLWLAILADNPNIRQTDSKIIHYILKRMKDFPDINKEF
jgi:hypothetical protein